MKQIEVWKNDDKESRNKSTDNDELTRGILASQISLEVGIL